MNQLITISPSHYCEKSRWSLELAAIPFSESAHCPFFHISAVQKSGGNRTTPVLKTDATTFTDSTDITAWIAKQPERQWEPYGSDIERSKAQEKEFGRKLGVLTRLVAYHHLLPLKKEIVFCMTTAPASEQKWFSLGYPVFRYLMKKAMNINPSSAQKAEQSILDIFDAVEKDADGEFLIGSALTIADISFAALAAPIILPEKYGAPLPTLSTLPSNVQNLINQYREHPAGQRVLRLYEKHR